MSVFIPNSLLAGPHDIVMVGEFVYAPVKLNAEGDVLLKPAANVFSLDKIPDKIPDHDLGVITRQIQMRQEVHFVKVVELRLLIFHDILHIWENRSMALTQLKLLINLARVDGQVVEKERTYILNIGKANNIKQDEIMPLFDQEHEIVIPKDLSDSQRFDYIFSLVQLMKIDERLYKDEIRFCARVASKLGYDQAVVFDLMLHVRAAMQTNELEELRNLTAKYLNQ